MRTTGGIRVAAVWLALAAITASCTGARLDEQAGQVTAGRDSAAGAGTVGGDAADGTTTPEAGDTGVPTGGAATSPAPGANAGAAAGDTESGPPAGASGAGAPGATAAPATAPPPVTGVFTAAEDTTGITANEIRLCAHAALTYGAAFNTGAADLNVYWSAVNDAGGIHGRAVRMFYENDNYTPTDAVKAATACRDKYDPFMLIGGIGFDQIPAVRNWAEQNRMLYFHHTATANGFAGKRMSYTGLPTTEHVGELFAELAGGRFRGKKVGIVKRQSENWEPGVDGFKRVARERGIRIVLDRPVPQNKGSYIQDILDLRNAGAEVVWVWLNALETTTFIKQAKAQGFSPQFMVFPFNLSTQTLDADALNPPLVGIAMWNAYSEGDRSGPFAAYADDLREFEAQYRKYRPSVDLGGVGGDLLFLNWSGQKVMHQLLLRCGPDCTRNRFMALLRGFNAQLTSSACALDFTRPGADNDRRGGWTASVLEAYRSPSGRVNLRNVATCVEHL